MDAGIADTLTGKSFAEIIAILLGLSEHDSFVVSLHRQDNFFESNVFLCFRNDFADLLDVIVNVVFHVTDLNVNRIAVAEIQS